MAKLTAFNERQSKNKIIDLIYDSYKTKGYPRPYIGMSGLGGCVRSLWYGFRFAKQGTIEGRTSIIFETGHNAEIQVTNHLKKIGIKLSNTLDDQEEYICAYGYSMGHGDGAATYVPGYDKDEEFLLEIKTANDASFKSTVKGKVKKAKPTYYAQMVLYMHFTNRSKALFIMYNKNTSAYYTEIVDSNEDYALELVRKAESIVWCEDPISFPRIGNNTAQWYECRWCGYNDICFGKELPEKNCRNCSNFNLLGEGKFGCGIKDDVILSLKEQEKGCKMYKMMECFKNER